MSLHWSVHSCCSQKDALWDTFSDITSGNTHIWYYNLCKVKVRDRPPELPSSKRQETLKWSFFQPPNLPTIPKHVHHPCFPKAHKKENLGFCSDPWKTERGTGKTWDERKNTAARVWGWRRILLVTTFLGHGGIGFSFVVLCLLHSYVLYQSLLKEEWEGNGFEKNLSNLYLI